MAFTGLKLTDFGLKVNIKAQAGKQLKLTHVSIGDGEIGTGSFLTRKTLISEKLSTLIDDIRISDTSASIISQINNTNLENGFYFREMGIYCVDPDTQEEGLYVYDNCREQGEYIGDKNSAVPVNFYMRMHVALSQSEQITFVPSGNPVYVLYEEFDKYKQISDNHETRILTLESGLANIDCGVWDTSNVLLHSTTSETHFNLLVDGGNVTAAVADYSLETHMTDAQAHQNLLIDGNIS